MKKRFASALATAAITAAITMSAAGVASAAGQPAGAQVVGRGLDAQVGVAYAQAQTQARNECASRQVVQRVSEDIQQAPSGKWSVVLVLVCG